MRVVLRNTVGRVGRYVAVPVATGAFFLTGAAMASTGGVDYSSVTSGVDFADVAAAIVGACGLLMVALVARKGGRLILGLFGR